MPGRRRSATFTGSLSLTVSSGGYRTLLTERPGGDQPIMTTMYDTRPWLRYYPPGVPAEAEFPRVPVTDLLDNAVRHYARHTALIFLGGKLTYRELAHQVDLFAEALRGLGVHKGDRVAMVLPNCPQQVISFFAILRRGAVVVQNNPLYTAAELHTQLADSGARIVVVFDRVFETVEAARQGTSVKHVIVTSLTEYLPAAKRLALRLPLRRAREKRAELTTPLPEDLLDTPDTQGPPLSFRQLMADARPRHSHVAIDPERDIAVLQYTGGTTGTPKGAMLTHTNLVANAHQTAAWDPGYVPGQDVTLAVLPMFHVFGLTLCLTTTVLIGGTIVLVPTFDLDLVLGEIRRWRPTILPGVPPIYQQIADSPQARSARLNSIRTCVSGAMQLRRETVEAFRAATGVEVVQGYGMTETSPVIMANPLHGNARHISVGVPMPGTVARIVSESDPSQTLPVGHAGELLVRGPQVFAGYWNQPKETAEVLSNGWLRTGDIAVMSPDGFFTLLDRKRDVIIVDGLNVYPSEVEEVLNSHPGIRESAVVGVPDPLCGECVTAYVVLVPGLAPARAELISYCAERLAGYKVPSQITARDELPHNMLGKVLRRVVRGEATAGAAGHLGTPTYADVLLTWGNWYLARPTCENALRHEQPADAARGRYERARCGRLPQRLRAGDRSGPGAARRRAQPADRSGRAHARRVRAAHGGGFPGTRRGPGERRGPAAARGDPGEPAGERRGPRHFLRPDRERRPPAARGGARPRAGHRVHAAGAPGLCGRPSASGRVRDRAAHDR